MADLLVLPKAGLHYQNGSCGRFCTRSQSLRGPETSSLHLDKTLLHYPIDQIARLLKMKNLWRVRRKLQKALKLIRKKLKEKGIELSDI